MKENKNRILFWLIIMLISFALFYYGKNYFNQGYGTYGKIFKILDPIATDYNTLDAVKRLTDIRATVSKDQLVINYKNSEGKTEKYRFKYVNENGIEYITNKDEYNTNTWNTIIRHMTDAIYHANGGKGSVFSLYNMATFKNTTLKDGILYNDTTRTVSFNIRANIVNNIKGKFETINDNIYAKDEDLTTLISSLEKTRTFLYNQGDLKMYIQDKNDSYKIYVNITDLNKNRAYLSIANAVKVLKPKTYEKLNIVDNIVTFDTSSNSYTIIENSTTFDTSIFTGNESILEFTLSKK